MHEVHTKLHNIEQKHPSIVLTLEFLFYPIKGKQYKSDHQVASN